MLVTRAELPVRPAHHTGESIAGYIYSIYGSNGHSVPQEIATLIHVLYHGRKGRFLLDAFEELQRIIGPQYDLCADRWLKRGFVARDPAIWERWATTLEMEFRYCPKCLTQYGYHLAIWERRFVAACPVHTCRLVRRCSSCKRPLKWRTLEPDWRCPCGQLLSEIQPVELSPQIVGMSRYLCRTWDTDLPANYPLELPRSPQSLSSAYRTIYHLALLRGLVVSIYRDANRDLELAHRYALVYLRKSRMSITRRLSADGFRSTICKLMRIRWRDTEAALIHVPCESREMAIFKFIASIDSDCFRSSSVSSSLNHFFISFEVPLNFYSLVIFNPRVSLGELRLQQTAFLKWCKRQFKASPSLSESSETRSIGTCLTDMRESATVAVLNRFIRLSNAQTNCNADLRAFVSARLFPRGVPDGEEKALTVMAQGLIRLAETQFKHLSSLLDQQERRRPRKVAQAHGAS